MKIFVIVLFIKYTEIKKNMKKQSHNITAYISKYLLYTGKPNQDSQCQLTTSNSKKFDDSFPNQSFHN